VLGGIAGPLLVLLALKVASAGSVSLWLNLEFVATVLLGHFVFREYLTAYGWIAAIGTLAAALLLANAESARGILPIILVAGGALCWGIDNHLTALIDGIPPSLITFWKGIFAGGFNLLMGIVMTGGPARPNLVVFALIIGAVSYGLSITLYVTAAHGLGATRSQMVFSTAPFFGLFLSITLFGEAFTNAQILAAVLMIASLVILFREKHSHSHRHEPLSHLHRHSHDGHHHRHLHSGTVQNGTHVHHHQHDPVEHSHDHLPDLHHRHDHEDQ
jgi:drug/metabolite transporter (DMT)-like permease